MGGGGEARSSGCWIRSEEIRGGGVINHVTPWPTVPKMLRLNYVRSYREQTKMELRNPETQTAEGGGEGV